MILVGSATTALVVTWIHNRIRAAPLVKEVDIVITNKDPKLVLTVHNDDHVLSLPFNVTMSDAGRFTFTLPFNVRIENTSTPIIWTADTTLYRNTPFSLAHVVYNSDTGFVAALVDNAQPLVDGDGQLMNVSLECSLLMHLPHVRIRGVKIINDVK